jgi:hypothetical protein
MLCYYLLFYFQCGLCRNSTMAECSPVRLSTAVCEGEPTVLWFTARLCHKSERASNEAELCT